MAARQDSDAAPPSSHGAAKALGIVLLVVAFLLAWPYRGPVAFALVVAYLAYPLYARLELTLGKRWLAGLSVLSIVAAVLIAPFVLLAGLLLREVQAFAAGAGSADQIVGGVTAALERVGLDSARAELIVQQARERAATFAQEGVMPALSTAASFSLSLTIFFILLYFALVDGRRLVAWIHRLSPLHERAHRRLLDAAGLRVKALVWGSVLIALGEGIVAGLGWWILGMPSPILWGTVMMVLALIPIVGPFLVLIPGTIYAFATGNYVAAVGLLVLNFVFVGLVDDLVRPWLVGRWTSVHPAIILLGILGGIPLMGLSGIILGPLLLSLVAPVLEAWLRPGEGPLEKPRTPDDPEPTKRGATRGRGIA